MTTGNIVICCIMALIIVSYKFSATARYYLKFTIFCLYSLICSGIALPLMMIRPKRTRNIVYPSTLFRPIAKFLGFSYSFRGLENLDSSKGGVIIINHQSTLDVYTTSLILCILECGILVVKKSLLYAVPLGTGFWLSGAIFVDRSNPDAARDSVNRQIDVIRNKKGKLVMFPEGTRSDADILLPFKKAAFHAAVAAQCPIQPIVVSKYHFLDHKRKRFTSGRYIIKILPGIETEGMTKDDIPALIEKAYSIMQDTFTEVSAETRP